MSLNALPPAGRTVTSTDGVSIALHDLGGDGVPVLAVHATGFHGRVWAPLAHWLRQHHVWAPDLRGHGDSVTPPGHDFAWSKFADDVLACVDALAADGVDLRNLVGIGHSKGGAALLLAEQRRPGTFRGLWVYEPVTFPAVHFPADGSLPENPLASSARRRRSTFPSLDAAYENFAAKPPMDVFAADALAAYVGGGFRPTPGGEVELKCRPEDEARVYEMAQGAHAFEGLGDVACPTLVVRGRIEVFGPAAIAEAVSQALPTSSLEVHEALGHFGPMEYPEAMATSIELFLDEAVTRSA